MTERPPNSDLTADMPALIRKLAKYRSPDRARSLFELLITVGAFVGLWAVCWAAVDSGYWIGLLAIIPAAGLLVRLFLIQHDCGHRSFFASRAANDWIGRILGVVTLTPYDDWRRSHAMHHATSGNLDRRGFGDIDTLTVREFRARGCGPAGLSPVSASGGHVRHRPGLHLPPALPGAVAAARRWQAALGQRHGDKRGDARGDPRHDLAGRARTFLAIQLPITLLAATIGVWLFYVQHQFDGAFWERNGDWDIHEAALHGSSHYDLPPVLRWFTANIGVHHVHHLASRIPFYRLPSVMREQPELREVGRLTTMESLRSVRLVLWDEDSRRLISFSEAAESGRPGTHPRRYSDPGVFDRDPVADDAGQAARADSPPSLVSTPSGVGGRRGRPLGRTFVARFVLASCCCCSATLRNGADTQHRRRGKDRDRALMIVDGIRDAGNYEITVIGDVTGLARRLAALAPDVVLIDLESPDRDVLDALTLASAPSDRPVAMFVDRSDDGVMRAAIDAGVSAYVVGGLSRERIRPVLTAAIARFHMVARLRAELAATKAALEERKVVDRAKGMLMKAKGISEEEAYAALRRAAMTQGRKVADIAHALLTAADLLK